MALSFCGLHESHSVMLAVPSPQAAHVLHSSSIHVFAHSGKELALMEAR
jgi:hypothetical protein